MPTDRRQWHGLEAVDYLTTEVAYQEVFAEWIIGLPGPAMRMFIRRAHHDDLALLINHGLTTVDLDAIRTWHSVIVRLPDRPGLPDFYEPERCLALACAMAARA